MAEAAVDLVPDSISCQSLFCIQSVMDTCGFKGQPSVGTTSTQCWPSQWVDVASFRKCVVCQLSMVLPFLVTNGRRCHWGKRKKNTQYPLWPHQIGAPGGWRSCSQISSRHPQGLLDAVGGRYILDWAPLWWCKGGDERGPVGTWDACVVSLACKLASI